MMESTKTDGNGGSSHRFHFPELSREVRKVLAGVAVTVFLLWVLYDTWREGPQGNDQAFIIILILVLIVLRRVHAGLYQIVSDLEICGNGIARYVFGHRWLFMAWHDICEIRIDRNRDNYDSSDVWWSVAIYPYIRSKKYHPFRRITYFYNKLNSEEERRRLQDMLNYYIQKHDIPVYKRNALQTWLGLIPYHRVDEIDFNEGIALDGAQSEDKNDQRKQGRVPIKIVPKPVQNTQAGLPQDNEGVMWLYCVDGVEKGPIGEVSLREAILRGEIKHFDTVKKVDDRFWSPVSEVLEQLGLSIAE